MCPRCSSYSESEVLDCLLSSCTQPSQEFMFFVCSGSGIDLCTDEGSVPFGDQDPYHSMWKSHA